MTNPLIGSAGNIYHAPDSIINREVATPERLVNVGVHLKENGAGDEIRTHDFNLGKVALYP